MSRPAFRPTRCRRLALVAIVGSLVAMAACGDDDDADASSVTALVEHVPAESEGPPFVWYFNLEGLREETGEDLNEPPTESRALLDAAGSDLLIGEPFRTQMTNFIEEPFPISLEQTMATLSTYDGTTVVAADIDSDELSDALSKSGVGDVERDEADDWEIFRAEADEEVVPGYGFDEVAVASNGDHVAIGNEAGSLDAMLELEDGDALGDQDGIDELAAAIDDSGAFAALLVVDGPADYESDGDSGDEDDPAPLAPWDRVAFASVYDGAADEYSTHVFLWHDDPDAVDVDEQAQRLTTRLEASADCETQEPTVDGAIVEASCVTDEPMMIQLQQVSYFDIISWSADS